MKSQTDNQMYGLHDLVSGNRWLMAVLLAYALLWLGHGTANAQLTSSNPLEYVALAEGNELINAQIKAQIEDEQKTALLQNTIAAEFTMIHSWEKKYNLKKAITGNPQGIVATMSMNNLYIETATELVSVYTTLRDAIAKGGKENMLTGAERSKTLWALNDRLDAFNKKLSQLYLSIRYYNMMDVWENATAGMLDRSNGEIAEAALGRWKRTSRIVRP